jgi:tetratricopeptide (TPR) repeat protein
MMPFARLLVALAAAAGVVAFISAAKVKADDPPPSVRQAQEAAAARAKRLDGLFASLQSAKEEPDADLIVAEIWRTWLQSSQPELDRAMEEVITMMAFGQLDAAMATLDVLVARAPEWAEAWNKRATVLYMRGEFDRSLADIDRVLALEPRHFGALAGQGLIRMGQEKDREALSAFRKALRVNPFLKERLELIPSLERKLGEKPT